MTKVHERDTALRLRKSGESIGAIAKKLGVSKGSVSYWCKDIHLTEKQLEHIAHRSKHRATHALLRAAEKRRADRKKNILYNTRIGEKVVGDISDRDLFMVGLGLYWGEGYKKGNQEFGFTNSDPGMIALYIRWLDRIYSVSKERLTLRISINRDHIHRISRVEKFWSILTKIPLSQFTKPSFVHTTHSKKYTSPDDHYGTLRVKVKCGTELRRQVLGSIKRLQESI